MKKPVRVLLINGIATVNLRGHVKTSLDIAKDDVELSHDQFGVWVSYKDKTKEKLQLIPNGCFSNVLFEEVPEPKKASK